MNWRSVRAAAALLVAPAALARAQEHPVQRVANIVIVAVEEYGKGIDEQGKLISEDEYKEALDFLSDAQKAAARLPSNPSAAAMLDSIRQSAQRREPPSRLQRLAQQFAALLGSEAALQLPSGPPDTAEGARLFLQQCATCHGQTGRGDGPAARTLNPKPPALADASVMGGVSPEMAFRKISVGVTGTAMPAFGSQLSESQRWNLVAYVTGLRWKPRDAAQGEGLFLRDCASCHGTLGMGDGPLARSLSKLPPEIGLFTWQVQRSDSQLIAAIRSGVDGTPMPGDPLLSAADAGRLAAYMRSLPLRTNGAISADGHAASNFDLAAKHSLTLLEQSIAAARDGRQNEANDRAFDSYLAFEPIETPARAKNPGVVSQMEKLYSQFKVAVSTSDLRGAQQSLDAIDANMPRVLELTRPTGSGSEAFMQSFLIILREGFEAILVVGAVVAFLLKTGHRERLRSIWVGVVLALLASAATAVVLRTILAAIPASQEIIEGVTLLVAVCVLFSVSYWLISRVEAAKWQQFIREKVNDALSHGGGRALAFVAFLAVYREGAETALFYQALFNGSSQTVMPISLGIVAGFAALAIIFTLFYRYGVRIPLRPFFSVTSVLLYFMAFVFAGKGINELQEGGAVPMSVIPGLGTVDALGLYPTWQTVTAQLLLIGLFVFALAKSFWPKRSVALPTIPPPPAPADVAAELSALRKGMTEMQARLDALERKPR